RNSYTGRPTQGVWRDLPFRIRLGLRYGSAHKERNDSGDRHSAREAAHASRSYTSRTSLELKPVMGITWLSEAVACVVLAGPAPHNAERHRREGMAHTNTQAARADYSCSRQHVSGLANGSLRKLCPRNHPRCRMRQSLRKKLRDILPADRHYSHVHLHQAWP